MLQGNMGCKAGDMAMSYNYTIAAGGLDTAASYPFSGKTGKVGVRAKHTAPLILAGSVEFA